MKARWIGAIAVMLSLQWLIAHSVHARTEYTLAMRFINTTPSKVYVVNHQEPEAFIETQGNIEVALPEGTYSVIAISTGNPYRVNLVESIAMTQNRSMTVNGANASNPLQIESTIDTRGEVFSVNEWGSSTSLYIELVDVGFSVDLQGFFSMFPGSAPVYFDDLGDTSRVRLSGGVTPPTTSVQELAEFYLFDRVFDRGNPIGPVHVDARAMTSTALRFTHPSMLPEGTTPWLSLSQERNPKVITPDNDSSNYSTMGGTMFTVQPNRSEVVFTQPFDLMIFSETPAAFDPCERQTFRLSLSSPQQRYTLIERGTIPKAGVLRVATQSSSVCDDEWGEEVEIEQGLIVDGSISAVRTSTYVAAPDVWFNQTNEEGLGFSGTTRNLFNASGNALQREFEILCEGVNIFPPGFKTLYSYPRDCSDLVIEGRSELRLADEPYFTSFRVALASVPQNVEQLFYPAVSLGRFALQYAGKTVARASKPGTLWTFEAWSDYALDQVSAEIKVEGSWQPLDLVKGESEGIVTRFSAELKPGRLARAAHVRVSATNAATGSTSITIPGTFFIGEQMDSVLIADTDDDGTPDYKDEDSDGDGIPDLEDDSVYGTDNQDTAANVVGDMDGDGLTDLVVRNAPGQITYIKYSSDESIGRISVGLNSEDIPVAGDFDGDGIGDVAFRRVSSRSWIIQRSSDGVTEEIRFGRNAEDIPVPADYDGDGLTDLAIRRPSNQTFYVRYSRSGRIENRRFGLQFSDIPLTGDFDGDGKADFAVRRPSNAHFYILNSSDGEIQRIRFGLQETDIPLSGDFDGDGKTDVAFRRPSNTHFYILNSSDGEIQRIRFGLQETDIPVVGDYDGDGKADVAVRRPANSRWYILRSSDGEIERHRFGLQAHYVPLLAPYATKLALLEGAQ